MTIVSPLFKKEGCKNKLANTDERLLDLLMVELYQHNIEADEHINQLWAVLDSALPTHDFFNDLEQDEAASEPQPYHQPQRYTPPTVH